ncbi:MAG: ABC transporter permease, partial [Planctomycetota bacterium]
GPGEGFYAVARVVKDLVTKDLPKTSPRRIFALARLAFKEAIRRKVLFVVGLFLFVLLLAGWYLNTDSNDPARLYISFALTLTNYLVLVMALFISAFSLPNEIQSKTIYTIVTKPVRATEIVLGRMLGFIATGTLILVPMGLMSYLFVTRAVAHRHSEVVEVEELDDGSISGKTDYVLRHDHTFRIDPPADGDDPDAPRVGLTNKVRGHQHIVRFEEGEFSIGKPQGSLQA